MTPPVIAKSTRDWVAWRLVNGVLDHIASPGLASHIRNTYLTGLLTTHRLSQMHREMYDELVDHEGWA